MLNVKSLIKFCKNQLNKSDGCDYCPLCEACSDLLGNDIPVVIYGQLLELDKLREKMRREK